MVLFYPFSHLVIGKICFWWLNINSLKAEWVWLIMYDLGSYSLVYGRLQAAILLAKSSAAVMWRLETELVTKSPFWYCGCCSVSSGVTWRRSTYTGLDRRHVNRGTVSKLVTFRCDWHACSPKLWVFFHIVCCDDKKKNCCSSEYAMKDKYPSLQKSDCIIATESHIVKTTGYQYKH